MDLRLTKLETHVSYSRWILSGLAALMLVGFVVLYVRLDRLDARLESLANRLDSKSDSLHAKLDSLSARIDMKSDGINAKVDALPDKLDHQLQAVQSQLTAKMTVITESINAFRQIPVPIMFQPMAAPASPSSMPATESPAVSEPPGLGGAVQLPTGPVPERPPVAQPPHRR